MSEIITVLLAFISILVSVIAGILSYMLYHFIPMKNRVNTLWNSWFGVPDTEDDGTLAELKTRQKRIREDHTNIRDVVEDIQAEQNKNHDENRRGFSSIRLFLYSLSEALEEQDIDAPDPDEEIPDRRFYRGCTDRNDGDDD